MYPYMSGKSGSSHSHCLVASSALPDQGNEGIRRPIHGRLERADEIHQKTSTSASIETCATRPSTALRVFASSEILVTFHNQVATFLEN